MGEIGRNALRGYSATLKYSMHTVHVLDLDFSEIA